jgi:hypothetical protein
MTHWKQLTNPDYFGSHDLFIEDGKYREIIVTIVKIEKKIVKNVDGKEQECIVATTKETKPIVLNKTNCKTISRLLETVTIEKWAGHQIKIGVQQKVKAFGDLVDALRVRNEKVSQKAPQDYSKQLEAIRTAKDLTELQTIWKTLDNEGQAVCLATKDLRKTELTK